MAFIHHVPRSVWAKTWMYNLYIGYFDAQNHNGSQSRNKPKDYNLQETLHL